MGLSRSRLSVTDKRPAHQRGLHRATQFAGQAYRRTGYWRERCLIWPSHYTRGMVLRFSEPLYQNGIFDPHHVNFVIASFNPLFSVRLIPRLSLSKSTDDLLRGPFEKLSCNHSRMPSFEQSSTTMIPF